jgi:hypothetical protein
VSWEVIWIARWLDESSASLEPDGFEVCDEWIGQGGRVAYQWALRVR